MGKASSKPHQKKTKQMVRSPGGPKRFIALAVFVVTGALLFMYSKLLAKSSTTPITVQKPSAIPGATEVHVRRDTPPERKAAPIESQAEPGLPAVWSYAIKAEYPHDERAYLQGLAYHEGKLYESTGIYGETTVREVELKTGKVLKSTPLGRQHFGEGLAIYKAPSPFGVVASAHSFLCMVAG